MADEFDAFFLAVLAEQLHHVLNAFTRVKIENFQMQTSGLDAGEIKKVVDNIEQALRRVAYRRCELRLLVVEPGV